MGGGTAGREEGKQKCSGVFSHHLEWGETAGRRANRNVQAYLAISINQTLRDHSHYRSSSLTSSAQFLNAARKQQKTSSRKDRSDPPAAVLAFRQSIMHSINWIALSYPKLWLSFMFIGGAIAAFCVPSLSVFQSPLSRVSCIRCIQTLPTVIINGGAVREFRPCEILAAIVSMNRAPSRVQATAELITVERLINSPRVMFGITTDGIWARTVRRKR